jgi:hypothetical protein
MYNLKLQDEDLNLVTGNRFNDYLPVYQRHHQLKFTKMYNNEIRLYQYSEF